MTARRPIASIGQVTGLQAALDGKAPLVVPTVLAAPVVTASAPTSTSITLSWDAVTGADHYEVESSRDTDFIGGRRSFSSRLTTVIASDIAPSVAQYHRVRAVTAAGEAGTWSTTKTSGYQVPVSVADGSGGKRDWRMTVTNANTYADARAGVGAVTDPIGGTGLNTSVFYSGGKYNLSRSYLEFAYTLPTGGVISAAFLRLIATSLAGTSTPTTLVAGTWAAGATPVWTDTGAECATRVTPPATGNADFVITNLSVIGARTSLVALTGKDVDNVAPTATHSSAYGSADNATLANRPVLYLTWGS